METVKYAPAQMCRICLSEDGQMDSIFGTAENLCNVLMFVAAIRLDENDGLPAQICAACVCQAKTAFFFKQKCEESDKLLRHRLLQESYAASGCDQLLILDTSSNDVKQELELDEQQAAAAREFVGLFGDGCDSDMIFKAKDSIETCVVDPRLPVVDSLAEANNATDRLNMLIDDDYDDDNVETIADTVFEDDNHPEFSSKKQRQTRKASSAKRKIKVQCPECPEQFDKRIDLKRHMATEHVHVDGEKTFQCIECNKTYASDAILVIHMKTHGGRVYTCDACPKKFARLDYWFEHKKRHSNDRSSLCTKCGKGFYNQMYLNRHMQTHSRDHLEKPTFDCGICGKQMHHSNHLKVHMRTHRDRTVVTDQRLEPGTAGRTVAASVGGADVIGAHLEDNGSGELDATTPVATGERPKKRILCSVCGNICSSRSNLSVHMRRHTGKMSNFCTVCGKGYPRTTDLAIHMRQHTGEKPFPCKVCDRRFARSDKLAIHMRTHTGEKPYVCGCCGRGFAQSNDLALHKRRNACSAPIPATMMLQSFGLPSQTFVPSDPDILPSFSVGKPPIT